MYKIVQYEERYRELWNDFIEKANNGTFLFHRTYMEYHKNRFPDASLMIFYKNNLIGVIPATSDGSTWSSHNGLTYGGVIRNIIYFSRLKQIFEEVLNLVLKNHKAVIWKPVPIIYHDYPTDVEKYLLNNAGFTCVSYLSAYIPSVNNIHKTHFYEIKKNSSKHIITSDLSNLPRFWNILTENLNIHHNTKPTHSLDEISYLISNFSDNIQFVGVKYDGDLVGGMIIYLSRNVAHIQYIGANDIGKKTFALKFLMHHVLLSYLQTHQYIDIGISNERDGSLNIGLSDWKDKFGAYHICCDVFKYNYEQNCTF